MTPQEHYLKGEKILAGCEIEAQAIEQRGKKGVSTDKYHAECAFNTMAAVIAQAHFDAARVDDSVWWKLAMQGAKEGQ